MVAMLAMGCVWTSYGLHMGCVCVVREVPTACGGHRVRVDYLWVVCVL